MPTSTGELREALVECIGLVRAGKMSAADGKAVAMIAGQINLSLQVEVNARREVLESERVAVGSLVLGDGKTPEEGVAPLGRNPWPGAVTQHRLEG